MLDCVAEIVRDDEIMDEYKTVTKGRHVVGSIACAYSETASAEQYAAEDGRPAVRYRYTLYCLPGADIKPGDIARISREGINIGSFIIGGIYAPRGHHLECELQREEDA